MDETSILYTLTKLPKFNSLSRGFLLKKVKQKAFKQTENKL